MLVVSGKSLVGPVYVNWGRIYYDSTPNVVVNYVELQEVVASETQGITDVIAGNTDFGATELPANSTDYEVHV